MSKERKKKKKKKQSMDKESLSPLDDVLVNGFLEKGAEIGVHHELHSMINRVNDERDNGQAKSCGNGGLERRTEAGRLHNILRHPTGEINEDRWDHHRGLHPSGGKDKKGQVVSAGLKSQNPGR